MKSQTLQIIDGIKLELVSGNFEGVIERSDKLIKNCLERCGDQFLDYGQHEVKRSDEPCLCVECIILGLQAIHESGQRDEKSIEEIRNYLLQFYSNMDKLHPEVLVIWLRLLSSCQLYEYVVETCIVYSPMLDHHSDVLKEYVFSGLVPTKRFRQAYECVTSHIRDQNIRQEWIERINRDSQTRGNTDKLIESVSTKKSSLFERLGKRFLKYSNNISSLTVWKLLTLLFIFGFILNRLRASPRFRYWATKIWKEIYKTMSMAAYIG